MLDKSNRNKKQRDRRHKRTENNICQCGQKTDEQHTFCDLCRSKHQELHKIRYQKAKAAVFAVYGDKCACCGESDKRFLTVDHINGNGSKHRREGARVIVYWLIKNEFPPGFEILCWNCNSGRAVNGGICPHKDNYNARS